MTANNENRCEIYPNANVGTPFIIDSGDKQYSVLVVSAESLAGNPINTTPRTFSPERDCIIYRAINKSKLKPFGEQNTFIDLCEGCHRILEISVYKRGPRKS